MKSLFQVHPLIEVSRILTLLFLNHMCVAIAVSLGIYYKYISVLYL